jgi:hypothetical protein
VKVIPTQQVVIKVTNQDAHLVHEFINRHVLTIRVAIEVRIKTKEDSVRKALVQAYRAAHHSVSRVVIVPVSIQIMASRAAIVLATIISRVAISLVVVMVSRVAMVSLVSRAVIVLVTISSQKVRRVDTSLVSSVAAIVSSAVVVTVSLVVAMVSSPVVAMVSSAVAVTVSLAVAISRNPVAAIVSIQPTMIPMQSTV